MDDGRRHFAWRLKRATPAPARAPASAANPPGAMPALSWPMRSLVRLPQLRCRLSRNVSTWPRSKLLELQGPAQDGRKHMVGLGAWGAGRRPAASSSRRLPLPPPDTTSTGLPPPRHGHPNLPLTPPTHPAHLLSRVTFLPTTCTVVMQSEGAKQSGVGGRMPAQPQALKHACQSTSPVADAGRRHHCNACPPANPHSHLPANTHTHTPKPSRPIAPRPSSLPPPPLLPPPRTPPCRRAPRTSRCTRWRRCPPRARRWWPPARCSRCSRPPPPAA